MQNSIWQRTTNRFPAAFVEARSEMAGETLLRMGGSVGPRGYHCAWPDYVHLDDDDADDTRGKRNKKVPLDVDPLLSASRAAERPRWAPATRNEVSLADEFFHVWMATMPSATERERDTRRLILLRGLVTPDGEREDNHRYSWRQLGHQTGLHPETVKSRHAHGIIALTRRVNCLPEPCLRTLTGVGAGASQHQLSRRADGGG